MKMVVEKQAQIKKQKQVDGMFLRLVDDSIKRDEKLLKKLAGA